MANEKNLKPFKKGWAGGPGRPKDPPELHMAKQLTMPEFRLLMQRLINCPPNELQNFKGTVLEMALASTIQKAIKEGDSGRIEFFLQRLFGKVKDQVEISNPKPTLVKLKSGEGLLMGQEVESENTEE